MERLRSLEALVKELSSQLEQANTATSSEVGGSASSATSPVVARSQHRSVNEDVDTSSMVSSAQIQNHFGRLVLKDANRSRYVSSGFWSRVDVS